jgi:outer membrane protein OmpA-like peptidoglycan-associated protein
MLRRLALLLTAFAATRPALADGLSLALDPAPAGERALVTEGADVRGEATLRARVVADYAHEPLVLQNTAQEYDRVVEEQLWLHALAAFSFRHRFLFGVDLPFLGASSSGELPRGGATLPRASDARALGDPRVVLRMRLFGLPSDELHVGLTSAAWLPFGSEEAYASEGSLRFRGALVLDFTRDRFHFAADLGFRTRPSQELPGVVPSRVGTALTPSLFASYAVDAKRELEVGSELVGFVTVGGGAKPFDPRASGGLLLLESRWLIGGGPFEVGAGAGPGLGTAPGIADFRVLVFAGFGLEAPPPPPDRDEDGVPDRNDACIDLKGVPNADPALNGCPELPSDFDGDGIPDENDACPKEPGEPTGRRATHGCPKPKDDDSDGIPNPSDACPTTAGVPSKDPKQHGCPPPPPPAASLVGEEITISEQVQFEHGTAVIRPESDAILGSVAKVLSEHPDVEEVEVQGHTDDTGTPEINQKLSSDRAQAVLAWLVQHGVDAKRLTAKGYGQSKPIADNADEAGRAKNRRVEFRVTKQKGREP